MQENLQNPPKTVRECIDTLGAQGLKKFAGVMSAWIE